MYQGNLPRRGSLCFYVPGQYQKEQTTDKPNSRDPIRPIYKVTLDILKKF